MCISDRGILSRGLSPLFLLCIYIFFMFGLTATRKIRANPRWADLPVLAMTANAMSSDREQCLAAGMNAHLAKPIDPDELFAMLLKWLPAVARDKKRETAKEEKGQREEG
ncbi:response regulator, partial [Pseudomonas peli]|uniref:response regulator n=1 Tax=Pseudomonas peli TaxID=592361 RepID=UPI003D324024